MISYEPLFATMKSKKISSYELIVKRGFSKSIYYSLKSGNSCSTNTIDTLCKLLDCSVSEVIEYIPDEK